MKSFTIIGLSLVALIACNKDRGRTSTTTTTGASVGHVANGTAIERIVAARCEREASCKNVGHDKRFETQQTCVAKVRGDMREDLSTKDCPGGVDQKQLDECLTAIRKEDCNNPIDLIERLTQCRPSDMCVK